MTRIPVARDDTTADFFDGTARGQFLVRSCAPSGHVSRPQARQCSVCGSTDLHWQPASGRAALVSWALVPGRRPGAADDDQPPTIVAIGQLDEGPWWWSQLVGAGQDSLAEGRRLRIAFRRTEVEGDEAVPVFELDPDAG
jgi:uncharacterized OB-fold protein